MLDLAFSGTFALHIRKVHLEAYKELDIMQLAQWIGGQRVLRTG